MNTLVDYQDPLAIALMIKANLSQDRPNALVVLTSNPGQNKDHYIALVQRVYADKNDLNSFVGYITYRYNDVKRKAKKTFLPEFSSIEIRDSDFYLFDPPLKTHFFPAKVEQTDPQRYASAEAVTSANLNSAVSQAMRDDYLAQTIGQDALMEVYDNVLALIDGRI